MPKYRKKIRSGDVYEVEEFYSPRTIGKKYERGRERKSDIRGTGKKESANRQKENNT